MYIYVYIYTYIHKYIHIRKCTGHSAVLGLAQTEGGGGRPVMTVFGGRSPNCSDYCCDLWQYSILDNSWFMVLCIECVLYRCGVCSL